MKPSKPRRLRGRLVHFIALLLIITVGGTTGFVIIEGWRVGDALYMTVITLSTVGFSEVQPLSPAGRLFTTALILAGVTSVAYLFSAIGQNIVSGELRGTLRRRRMQRRIDEFRDHYIICGYGRVGGQAARSLQERGKTCVIVESNPEGLEGQEIPFVIGDAADDDVLRSAGIERAAGLVAATGDDATNLFITVSAYTLRPDLNIVARANQPATEAKLLRGGASNVISPYTIGGRRIAAQLVHPTITDFLDVVMHSGELELCLEEFPIGAGSDLHGKTVAEVSVRQRTGANVLAMRRNAEGRVLTNPPSDLRFEPGDVLIALGTREQLQALDRLARL